MTPEGPPAPETSLAELVSAAAIRDPDGVAAVCGPQGITYADLDRAVGALGADLLDRGIAAGQRVAVVAGNGLEFVVMAYAVLRSGAVLVPISPSSPAAEITGMLRTANVEIVLSDVEHEAVAWAAATAFDKRCGAITLDVAAKRSRGDRLSLGQLTTAPKPPPPARLHAAAPAVILFTSGSTSRPKGVVHSHESLFRNALSVAWEMTALTSADSMLSTVPLAHSFGLSAVMNACLLAGARIELLPKFDSEPAWRLIRDRGVTVITGVPTMYRRLADDEHASRNTDLRLAVVSGAPCPRDLARDVRLRMGVHVVERYGMTEASPLTWRVVSADSVEGDVGWPGWGVHIRAVDPEGKVLGKDKAGELEVEAPSMLLRYLSPEDNREGFHDGWLRTGDIGLVRADSGVTLKSRLKDIILRGGYSVATGEVERAIVAHKWVADAAVVGVPDRELGEELAAAVVLRKQRRLPAELDVVADLERHMGDRLASWKRPRLWKVVDKLPRTPLGKVKREELLRLFDQEE
ncbi:MAG: class I adenylate-forming enzyme family protein [Candidatus Dormiibacterota bacterium]